MSVTISPPMFLQFLDPNNTGAPLAGGKLFTYIAGTSTKQATWTDSTQITQNSNPIILDANGAANVWPDPSLIYKYILAPANDTDPPASPIRSVDNIESAITNRVLASFITQALIGPVLYPRTALEIAAGVTPTNYIYPPGNVLRYGADPTGVADCTTAFNTASFATYVGWSPTSTPYRVYAPAGKYKFSGATTIYIRSGQLFCGDGQGTILDFSSYGAVAYDAIRLGWGLISGTPTQDAGGQPVEACEFFALGGPSGGGSVVGSRFAGTQVHDIFFSGAGLAVYAGGSCLVYDCTIDIGLSGITVGGGNVQIDNIQFFQNNFGVSWDTSVAGDISDVQITNCQFLYTKVQGISIGSGGTLNIRGVKVSACKFLMNAQNATYQLFALLNASNSSVVEFEHCTFNNWGAGGAGPYFAVQVNGTGTTARFKGCVFDGQRTNIGYTQSLQTSGIQFVAGTLNITDCEFYNLNNNAIAYQGTSATQPLKIDGMIYSGLGGVAVNITNNQNNVLTALNVKGDGLTAFVNNQASVRLQLQNTFDWWGVTGTSGGSNFVTVPYQHSTCYRVTLTANVNAGGNGNYSKMRCDYVEKNNDFAAGPVLTSYISQTTAFQSAAHGNGTLTLTAEFDAVGGTQTVTPLRNSGSIAISWPNTYSQVALDIQMINSGLN